MGISITGVSSVTGVSSLSNVGLSATGGTITYDGDYAIHTFTEDGTFTVTASNATDVEVLMVAGGGGYGVGSYDLGGYGGAGGLIHENSISLTVGTGYPIVIGAGGSNANGQDTTAFGNTAIGGGRGGRAMAGAGAAGGSGGGGALGISGDYGSAGGQELQDRDTLVVKDGQTQELKEVVVVEEELVV